MEHRAARRRATTDCPRHGRLRTAPRAGRQEEEGVNSQATDPRMIEALDGATSLQLYQLKSFIEGMLADPRRGLAARANLHLGQAVRFVDFRDGQMRRGKIIAIKDTQATVLEEGTKRTWKIPCVAIDPDAERHATPAPYEPPAEPVVTASKAREFNRGDTVTFDDRDGRALSGVIVRINQRTATTGISDGRTWRVPFQMLRHVLDV